MVHLSLVARIRYLQSCRRVDRPKATLGFVRKPAAVKGEIENTPYNRGRQSR